MTTPSFEKLSPRTSATVAAEQALRRRILDGTLAPGSTLPPERELAAMLGVSRLTLRAALATLAAADLVRAHHGKGYEVKDFRRTGGSDLLGDLVEMATEPREQHAIAGDLLRIRRHLAGAVLDALAERPPNLSHRRAIAAAIDGFTRAIEAGGDDTAISRADLAVVEALLDATQSTVLRVCLNPIVAVVDASPQLRAALYREPHTNLLGWRALATWLERAERSSIPRLVEVLAAHDRETLARLRRSR